MSGENKLTTRIFAVAIITFGIIFGSTWNSIGFCLGEYIFSTVGLPVWSGGTGGIHYPGIIGLAFILIGTGIWNTTLSKKTRTWIWGIVITLFMVINVLYVYLK